MPSRSMDSVIWLQVLKSCVLLTQTRSSYEVAGISNKFYVIHKPSFSCLCFHVHHICSCKDSQQLSLAAFCSANDLYLNLAAL